MAEKRMKSAAMVLAVLSAVFGIFAGNAMADLLTIDLRPMNVTVTKDADGFAKFTEVGTEEGIQYLSQPGEPAIPYRVVKALLPPGADLSTLQVNVERAAVTSEAVSSTEAWEIRPMPVPQVNADPPALNASGENEAVYNTSIRFPYSIVGNISTGALWEWQLADIPIALYHWNPVTKGLFTLQSSQAVLTFEHKSVYGRRTAQTFTGMGKDRVKNMAVNFDQMAAEYPAGLTRRSSAQEQSSYVIITTNAIRSASAQMGNFIQHKENRGYAVRVITENIWGGGTGNTAAENIRNWLIANYEMMNIEYVLLIGNPNPATGDVPMKMLWPRNNATRYPDDDESPSDYYYSDLTGNWDLDGDGRFGEEFGDFGPGGVDRNYEVIVGRIPYYGNAADLDSILAKTIAYQNETNQEWRKKVLLPMEPSDADTPGYHLGEIIKNNVLAPKGWGFHRVYDSTYSLSPAPETMPCSMNNVTTAWNAQDYGAVFWWTHGNKTGAADIMDLSHAAMLDNAHPAFTFQCSCENSYPEQNNNLSYSLLKNGAIATVGATRVSWYYVGSIYFAGSTCNAGMTYEYAKRLIQDEMKSGRALQDLKQTLMPEPWMWMNFTVFCLYGDPEVSMVSDAIVDEPPVISEIPDQSTNRDTEITIPYSVSDDYTPASALAVTAYSSDNSIVPNENIIHEGNGENRAVRIMPAENQVGQATVTIEVDDGKNKISQSFVLRVNKIGQWTYVYPERSTNENKAVWGTSESNVYAVGAGGDILHYDGNQWTETNIGTDIDFEDIWGTSGTNIYAVGNKGTVFHYNGSNWSEIKTGIYCDFKGIWGSSENSIYVVGNDGTIVKYDGNKWQEMTGNTDFHLTDIWGTGDNGIYAVGVEKFWPYNTTNQSVILYFNGNTWTVVKSDPSAELSAVWGTSPNNVYVAGSGKILHYNGNIWEEISIGYNLYGIWGNSENDIYAVGYNRSSPYYTIIHYNGEIWSESFKSESIPGGHMADSSLFDIWGTPNKIFVVGSYGTVFIKNGNEWSDQSSSDNKVNLYGIWGTSDSDLYVVGEKGTILHFDGNQWIKMESGKNYWFTDIWASDVHDIFIVGAECEGDSTDNCRGVVIHYDGNSWSEIYSKNGFLPFDIWGDSKNNIFVGGIGGIIHYDGSTWTNYSACDVGWNAWVSPQNEIFSVLSNHVYKISGNECIDFHYLGDRVYHSIWGTSNENIHTVGWGKAILHYDGNSWMGSADNYSDLSYWGIWGSSENDIYLVGDMGVIKHFDGKDWVEMESPVSNTLHKVWGLSGNDVYAIGYNGTILHYSPPAATPILQVSPSYQNFSSASGSATFNIYNAGTGSLSWQISEDCSWLSVTPSSGTNNGTVTITYNTNPGDQRTGKILITAPGAANSPKEITITQAPKAGQHFTQIWTGNPYNRMNFYVVGATLNSIPLSIGDEIAIFDGTKCVGMAIVDGTISERNMLIIKTSQDDGSGNGFTNGHSITFKYWDVSAGQEITLVTPAFKDITGGNPVSAPVFEGLADYGVALSSGGTNQQTLSLNKGWNIMSSYIVPQNTDMLSVVQPLISNGTLNKVISETGDTIINVFGTWMNTIGNYDPEEGYKIKLNNGSQLTIAGSSSAPALSNMYASTQSVSIPLTAGWNIVSYPFTNSQDAMAAVQTLINAGVLEKVIDETGNSILKVFGKWTNRIGNLTAGKGYEIKVNKDAVLILYESGVPAARTEENRTVPTPTSHFIPVWTGNAFNRMELHIAGVNASVSIGDEIAVYDGSKCVGAAVVETQISYYSPLIITCSQDDGTGNGFTDGHGITYKLWDSSATSESTMPAPNYMELETGNPIAEPGFKGSEEYGVTWNPIDYRADINHNGKADLEDAILALRIVSGIPVENIYTDADVNNDQLIGIPEAVYALQKTAKLR